MWLSGRSKPLFPDLNQTIFTLRLRTSDERTGCAEGGSYTGDALSRRLDPG